MSLETLLLEMIHALNDNTAAIRGWKPPPQPLVPGDDPSIKPPRRRRRTKKEMELAKKLESERKALVNGPEPDDGLSLDDVRREITSYVERGKSKEVAAILKEFGATRSSELDRGDYRAFIERCQDGN